MTTAEGVQTMHTCWRVLSWSLRALYIGKWPTHDWNGVAYAVGTEAYRLAHVVVWLADGFFGVPWSIAGDLDYFGKSLGLETHSSAQAPCCFCPANQTTLNWRDFRPGAPWTTHVYTRLSWMATHPAHIRLFDLPFISILTLSAGWMHIKYLGVDQYFLAGCLYFLTHVVLQESPPQNLERVWNMLRAYYRTHNIASQYTSMTVRMFRNAKNCKLKGKAAEIKHLIPALYDVVLKTTVPVGIPNYAAICALHKGIRIALKLNVDLENIIDEHRGNKLPPDAAAALLAQCHRFLTVYVQLGRDAIACELDLFSETIKCHYLLHAAMQARWIHVRKTWCFSGEDFMKHSRRLMASCANATKPHSLPAKFVNKYLVAMHLLLRKKSTLSDA